MVWKLIQTLENKIEDVINKTDVLYVTRVQKERGSDHNYVLTEETLSKLKIKDISSFITTPNNNPKNNAFFKAFKENTKNI